MSLDALTRCTDSQCAARVGAPVLFDVVSDAAQWLADQCIAHAAAPAPTSVAPTNDAIVGSAELARLGPVLSGDAAFLVEQAARYRRLGVAFTWRTDVLPSPDADFAHYERERDAAVATLVAVLQRRATPANSALVPELAWSVALCARLLWHLCSSTARARRVGAANDDGAFALSDGVPLQVLRRGRTFVRRVLAQFGWQAVGALQFLERADTTWPVVIKLLARDASPSDAKTDVAPPQAATRLLEAAITAAGEVRAANARRPTAVTSLRGRARRRPSRSATSACATCRRRCARRWRAATGFATSV